MSASQQALLCSSPCSAFCSPAAWRQRHVPCYLLRNRELKLAAPSPHCCSGWGDCFCWAVLEMLCMGCCVAKVNASRGQRAADLSVQQPAVPRLHVPPRAPSSCRPVNHLLSFGARPHVPQNNRRKLRDMYGLKENGCCGCGDCCTHWCCPCCTLCQEVGVLGRSRQGPVATLPQLPAPHPHTRSSSWLVPQGNCQPLLSSSPLPPFPLKAREINMRIKKKGASAGAAGATTAPGAQFMTATA